MNHKKLIIGISSRALFNLDESHKIYEKKGVEAYSRHQMEKEDITLEPGHAFPLVKKLLALKKDDIPLVEVVLISKNSSDTGLRVFKSIEKHSLNIARASFSGGGSSYSYLSPFGCNLFLSNDAIDVRSALEAGEAAAQMLNTGTCNQDNHQIRIAFDGDAVLFSDKSERIFKEYGLEAFQTHEKESKHDPMQGGPFKGFLAALHEIQSLFPADESPIRTALVTARAAPAHERVINTLRSWDIRIDESLFLGGLPKGDFLRAFSADIFFDDQKKHVENAAPDVTSGHVIHGVANE
ncbi:MAG: 5'-nucleotidase [Gammaproteobacteria bacterium]|jgi:5'-nucleotidase|nr:5'-nucleotidase [Gammaproteobacteria bacterium]